MIPYDDLVAALSAWRVRQGLPVEAQLAAVAAAPPARSAPPMAPPGRPPTPPAYAEPAYAEPPVLAEPPGYGEPLGHGEPAQPAPLEEVVAVDDGALLEEASYEAAGDYSMTFASPGAELGESTSIGVPPPPRAAESGFDEEAPSAMPPPPPRGGRGW